MLILLHFRLGDQEQGQGEGEEQEQEQVRVQEQEQVQEQVQVQRSPEWIPSVWRGCSWPTLSPGDVNTEAWSTGLWLRGKLTPPPCKTALV